MLTAPHLLEMVARDHPHNLNLSCVLQLWRHAIHYMAEVVLEGIAQVKARCSAIGRNAMSTGITMSSYVTYMTCLSLCTAHANYLCVTTNINSRMTARSSSLVCSLAALLVSPDICDQTKTNAYAMHVLCYCVLFT